MNRSTALGFFFVILIGSAAVYSLSYKNLKISDSPSPSSNGLIPDTLLNSNGKEVSSKLLKGKYVGLYFSASWCGPCRSFTPELIRFRNQYKDNFEVILVGGDGTSQGPGKVCEKIQDALVLYD